jgi:PrsW family intramembrane metalloprotease
MGFVGIIASVVWILIQSGSIYARVLLQKFAKANMIVIVALLISILILSSILPGGSILALGVTPLLISSAIEESSKHLMSIGLMSQDFAFSRRDIIIFTIFVVLGFVWIENFLYFFQAHVSLSTWIFRSFFSLTAHLLASVICAYAWWRAIAYEPASLHYILIFTLGIVLAVLTHLGYNLILEQGSMIGL